MRIVFALTAAMAFAGPAAADPAKVGYPGSIAAIGDSITQAYNADLRPFADGPDYSWSTGTRSSVQSAYLRIFRANPAIGDRRANVAKDGARMVDFKAQAKAAVAARADYVTVMLGSNDVCRRSEGRMTSVLRFKAQLESGLHALTTGLPDARVQLVSIPDVVRLWSLERGSFLARTVWRVGDICQSLLARPTSNASADVARRAHVRARTAALNDELAAVCAEYLHCRYDSGAVFGTSFARDDISSRDFFHPSRAGQARLAEMVWGRTFDFNDATPPASLAVTAPAPAGSSVALSAVDNVGVAGIEYRGSGLAWSRYGAPVDLPPGQVLEYRAVDVNGNIEAAHALIGGG